MSSSQRDFTGLEGTTVDRVYGVTLWRDLVLWFRGRRRRPNGLIIWAGLFLLGLTALIVLVAILAGSSFSLRGSTQK